MGGRTERAMAFLLVAAAHILFFMLIKWGHHNPESTHEVYSTALLIDVGRSTAKRSGQQKQSRGKSASAQNSEAAVNKSTSNTAKMPTDTNPQTDWRAEGGAAANAVVRRKLLDDALRPLLSKPKTLSPAPEKFELGIFTRTPTHQASTFENLGEGITREWVSDYCYWWSDMGPQGRVPRKTCLPEMANDDLGNLFKKLRPKYLDTPGKVASTLDDDPAVADSK
jgi:hypothetical protein